MCPTLRSRGKLPSQTHELQIDRCWGLPVLGAITTLIVCLPASYMGLLFVFFIEDYGYSRAHASWPQNVYIVGSHLSGLVVGVLQQHLPMASIAVMSSILACVSLTASAFSKDVVWVSITLGVSYGLGMGMFLTCVCVYSLMQFRKYRGTATSLIFVAWSASGLYAPPVLMLLRESYALQGSLLISGAVLLHAVPLSILLRYPSALRLDFMEPHLNRIRLRTRTSQDYKPRKTRQPLLVEQSFVGFDGVGDDNYTQKTLTRSHSTLRVPSVTEEEKSAGNTSSAQNKEVFLTTRENTELRQSYSVPESSTILLRSPAFYVFLVATVAGEYSLMAFAMTIVDYATDKGIELKVAAYLVLYGAVGQILGRLLIVPLSDCVPSTRSLLFTVAFVVEAVCAAAMPHVFSMVVIVALRMIETAAQGTATAIRGILLAHYLGIETITTCGGLFGLALIPVSLSSASIIGLFRDHMGSYDDFYRLLAGVNTVVAISLSAFFAVDSRRTRRCKLTRKRRTYPHEPPPDSTEPLSTPC
uniref:Putative monocarboxylate transporter n=1 Tax=Rhipicephalus pulchellus TaxID=72859 RepID=L7M0Q0_RHIPC